MALLSDAAELLATQGPTVLIEAWDDDARAAQATLLAHFGYRAQQRVTFDLRHNSCNYSNPVEDQAVSETMLRLPKASCCRNVCCNRHFGKAVHFCGCL